MCLRIRVGCCFVTTDLLVDPSFLPQIPHLEVCFLLQDYIYYIYVCLVGAAELLIVIQH